MACTRGATSAVCRRWSRVALGSSASSWRREACESATHGELDERLVALDEALCDDLRRRVRVLGRGRDGWCIAEALAAGRERT